MKKKSMLVNLFSFHSFSCDIFMSVHRCYDLDRRKSSMQRERKEKKKLIMTKNPQTCSTIFNHQRLRISKQEFERHLTDFFNRTSLFLFWSSSMDAQLECHHPPFLKDSRFFSSNKKKWRVFNFSISFTVRRIFSSIDNKKKRRQLRTRSVTFTRASQAVFRV